MRQELKEERIERTTHSHRPMEYVSAGIAAVGSYIVLDFVVAIVLAGLFAPNTPFTFYYVDLYWLIGLAVGIVACLLWFVVPWYLRWRGEAVRSVDVGQWGSVMIDRHGRIIEIAPRWQSVDEEWEEPLMVEEQPQEATFIDEVVLDLYAAGTTAETIAKSLHCPLSMVRKVLANRTFE